MTTRTDILGFIRKYADKNGRSPTMLEIAAGVGLVSSSTVYLHLKRLEHDGLIKRADRIPRGIVVLGGKPKSVRQVGSVKHVPGRGVAVSLNARGDSRRDRIFQFIQSYSTTNGYSPSLREMSEAADVSICVVHHHLGVLERDGYIERVPGVPRSIVIR